MSRPTTLGALKREIAARRVARRPVRSELRENLLARLKAGGPIFPGVLGYDDTLPWACRTCRHLRMIARIRPGVSVAAAERELSGLMAGLVRQYPTEYVVPGMALTTLHETLRRGEFVARLIELLL